MPTQNKTVTTLNSEIPRKQIDQYDFNFKKIGKYKEAQTPYLSTKSQKCKEKNKRYVSPES